VLYDSVLLVPRFPEEDTKTEATKEIDQVGGPVARALSAVSSLGLKSAIAAVLGNDGPGVACVESLRPRGVRTDGIQVVDGGSTRRSQVWVSAENASRTITYSRGTLPDLQLVPSLTDAIERAEVLLLDGRELQAAIPLAKQMRQLGKTVVVDAGGWKPDLESLLRDSDILIASSTTLTKVESGEPLSGARRLQAALGLEAVIVTAGRNGAWVLEKGAPQHVPAPPVQPVDTNGAGDTFAGGLTYGIVKSWPLIESVRFASGVAALGCEHFGDYFPSADEVFELIRREERS